MKKRINLLVYHDKYKKTEVFFVRLKKVIYSLMLFSILLSAFMLIMLNNKKSELNQLLEKKQNLEDQISKKQDIDVKYQIFSRKFLQLKKILDSDTNFYPYYKLINDSLKKATISALLESIEITKNKETNFTISFKDFNELINFLNHVEEISFLTHFNQLTLKNIVFNQNADQTEKNQQYNLVFTGQFKK